MKKKDNTEFKVIYFEDEDIVLEEEKRKLKPFMLFFFKYGRLITMLFATIAILTFIGGVALSISSIPRITQPDITQKTDKPTTIMEFDGMDNKIRTSSGAPITKDKAENLFDNGGKKSQSYYKITNIIKVGNDKIIYFSNGSAVIIYQDKSKLPIYVPDSKNISTKDNKIQVTGKTYNTVKKTTLPDGMNVYEFANDKIMTELGDDYKLYDKNKGNPINVIKQNNDKIIYFDNGSAVVVYNDNSKMPEYINDFSNIKIENNNIVINGEKIPATSKRTLPDGTTIYEFPNDKIMSESENKENYKLYDKDNIMYDKDGNIIDNNNTPSNNIINPIKEEKVGNDKIIYFDNGSAVIIYQDKNKDPIYVPNKDDVKIKDDKIIIDGDKSQTIDKKTLPDGTKTYEFDNGKVLIEKDDEYKLIDKEDLEFDDDGNLVDPTEESEIIIKDFTIKNNSDEKIKYRVAIEETTDYVKYGKEKLLPQYIYQKISINGNNEEAKFLSSNVWPAGTKLEDNSTIKNNTFIIYEGEIDGNSQAQIKVGFWVDYETITNDMQNKWFIGTLKLYSWQ